ncbi:amino acid ABC transporter substrate-binding protein [Rhizobium sp. CG5]|uniref:substrate-binding periplasmic protein n=1 Tax=Rhizobium sp. CG5 TaxID=2726076 RepID=UPI00203494D9|nr:transporter substrate-binding domain-containing protein [Rhizobium sp. CG5]MCM2475542.1 amino acid ABC transporter substrate-binding protein [Rhizobium sp. CG5]
MFDAPSQFTLSRRRLLTYGAGLAAGSMIGTRAFALEKPKLKTVKEGVITIAMSGTMPVTGFKDGKITGSDAEMVVAIAEKLGLGVEPNIMAWSATVESIKTGRADIMCGNMGWNTKRVEAMLLTDPIYYNGNFITMRKSMPFDGTFDLNDAKGFTVGTGTGYSYVPDLKSIPGVKEVKLYDTVDACIRDVLAGRLDFAVMDSMNVDYMIAQNPGLDLKQLSIKPNTVYPSLSGRGQAVMGMNSENTDLFDAVNEGIKWLWKTKKNAELLARNGMTSGEYMIPMEKNPRVGVDRDEKGSYIGPAAHTPKDFSAYFA